MEKHLSEKELEELKGYLEGAKKEKKLPVRIIFDGKQTSIRIPLEFVEIMNIDPVKDTFEFKIEIDENNNPQLSGRLIKNG